MFTSKPSTKVAWERCATSLTMLPNVVCKIRVLDRSYDFRIQPNCKHSSEQTHICHTLEYIYLEDQYHFNGGENEFNSEIETQDSRSSRKAHQQNLSYL